MKEVTWKFSDSKGRGYFAGLDPAAPQDAEQAALTIKYPNNTTLQMQGDPEIVKQIVDRLDGMTIEWQERGKNV